MAVALRGTSSSFNTQGNPPATITGQQNNDWIIGIGIGPNQFTNATGWTELNNQQDLNSGQWQYIAAKKVTGTNDAFSPTYSGTAGLWTAGFSGADTTLGYEQFQLTQWAGTASATYPPNVTPTLNDSIIYLAYGETSGPLSGTTPDPSSASGFSNLANSTAGSARLITYYKLLSGQGGVAQGPFTQTWTGSAYGPAMAIVIKPVSTGSYTITAAQGSYSLTGQAVGLAYSTAATYTLVAAQGSYSLNGQSALIDTSMNAAQGSYSLTGFAQNLLYNRLIVAAQGQYNLSGTNTGFVWSGAPVATGGKATKLALRISIGL